MGQKVILSHMLHVYILAYIVNSQVVNEFLPAGPGGPCGPGSPGGPTLSHKAQDSPLSPEKRKTSRSNK